MLCIAVVMPSVYTSLLDLLQIQLYTQSCVQSTGQHAGRKFYL